MKCELDIPVTIKDENYEIQHGHAIVKIPIPDELCSNIIGKRI